MASNPWQTKTRGGGQQSSAKSTPQNRSNNASPSQTSNLTQAPPRLNQDKAPPPANVWTAKGGAGLGGGTQSKPNGPRVEQPPAVVESSRSPPTFNSAATLAFLSRDAAAVSVPYKPAAEGGGKTWSVPANQTANKQSFFKQLATQVQSLGLGG